MEVNEDLSFVSENPFDGSLSNKRSSSLMAEKRHSSSSHMMMRREADDEDEDEDDDRSGNFHKEILYHPTTMINNNNHSNCNIVFSPNSASCYSNDTVLDGVDVVHPHHHMSVIAERKLRRMISNRESARRSRMRKKKQIEELQYQVGQLEISNRQFSEKLIQLFEWNQQILHENAELKRKVSSLQIILTDFLSPLRNLEDAFGNSNRRAEANSNSSQHLPS